MLYSRRRSWPAFLLILLALLLAGAAFAEYRSSRLPQGSVTGAPAVRPDMAGLAGANLGPEVLSSFALDGELDRLDGAGIRWIRMRMDWGEVEPERDRFDWDEWDARLTLFVEKPALVPVLVLDGAPVWARRPVDATNPLAPPGERSDFGRFAAAVATRYGPLVHYYQIWDEPNIAPHWGARPVNAADYAGLLREGALQIRGADPSAHILAAALAPNIEPGGANMNDIAYLDALYRAGAAEFFDIAAGQGYGFRNPPRDGPANDRLNFGRLSLLRAVMERNGDSASPLWPTSFGWYAAEFPVPQSRPWPEVTEGEQARYASEAFRMASHEWTWLGPLFWPSGCEPDSYRPGFALCAEDASPRPIWAALAATQMDPVMGPGEHDMSHAAITAGDGWRLAPGGGDPARDGSELRIRFYGTELALRVVRGAYWGLLRATVDGAPANALPRDEEGRAYLVLNDPLSEEAVVTLARGLPLREHELALTAEGGWGQWPLRGVLVTAATRASVPWSTLALASLLAAGAAGWMLARRRVSSAWLRVQRLGGLPRTLAVLQMLGFATLAVLFVSPNGYVNALLLALLGLLVLVEPTIVGPLLAASIPLWARLRPVGSWQFGAFELLLWMGVLALALRAWSAGRAERRRFVPGALRLDWPVFTLLGVALLATAAAERNGVAVREFRTIFLSGALFYWLLTRMEPWDSRQVWRLLDGLAAGLAVISLVALWQLATGQGRVDVEGVWRVRAFYGSPNNLALILDRTLPLALAVTVFGGTSPARRYLYAALSVLMAIACVATFSKGALLLGLPVGLGATLLLGAWHAHRRRAMWVLGAAIGLASILLLLLFQTPRFADLWNFGSGTTFIRLKLWQSAIRMAADHPLLGVGPDNFLYAYRSYYVLPGGWEELNLSHPHNLVLDLATRLGVLGLAAGIWLLGAQLVQSYRSWRESTSHEGTVIATGLLAGLLAGIAHGLIDNSFFLPDLMALLAMWVAILARWPFESTPRGDK